MHLPLKDLLGQNSEYDQEIPQSQTADKPLPNHGLQLCFPLELHAGGSDFRLYDGFDLKTYLLMRW